MLQDLYIDYIRGVRRYSARTQAIYRDVLDGYASWYGIETDGQWIEKLTPALIRGYEVHLLSEQGDRSTTVNLHLSVLSGFCKYLVREGQLPSNPVRLVPRPKDHKRLPAVYRQESVKQYLQQTAWISEEDFGTDKAMYTRRLDRLIVSCLYQTGMRRAELISLDRSAFDASRQTLRILGKGDKIRVIPLTGELCREITGYLECAGAMFPGTQGADSPLLLTAGGKRLYPMYIERVVKKELGTQRDITVRRSPHVLRHTLATGLLDEGADINSIKEMLGHSSLAATQVYTHNSIEKLRKVYDQAHPRSEKSEK